MESKEQIMETDEVIWSKICIALANNGEKDNSFLLTRSFMRNLRMSQRQKKPKHISKPTKVQAMKKFITMNALSIGNR